MKAHDSTDIARAIDTLRSSNTCAVDDGGLRELLMVAESLRNAAEALQARVMVEMQRRAHRDDIADLADSSHGPESPSIAVPTGTREEFVVDEIAVHLHCTRVAASHRFATAMTAATYPALADAWSRGAIDARKVQVIGEGLCRHRVGKRDRLRTNAHRSAGSRVVGAAGHRRRSEGS
jgi:hypothetical protein